VLQLIKISFRQIFTKSTKSKNIFILCFGVISLAVCLTALTVTLSLSQGFKDQVSLKLSSIDGHYRISSRSHGNYKNLDLKQLNEIQEILDGDSLHLSYSAYTEDYALANIAGNFEGLLVYGVNSKEALNIFNIDLSFTFDNKQPLKDNDLTKDVIPISIGSKLAEVYDLKLGDIFFIFPIEIDKIGNMPTATKARISHIFNSGFSEYDKSVSFIDLESSRYLFDYGIYSSGLIGTVKDPLEINDNFSHFFSNIDNSKYVISTWADRHENISKWLEVYSDPIVFVVLLIVVLAIFNMSLSLWILIQDKLKELSILFTLGFTKRKMAVIVIVQNLILTTLSVLLAGGLSFFILFIQHKYKLIKISEDIYFINYLPVSFNYQNILSYYVFLFLLSILISVIPAFKVYSLNIIKHININD